jgi:hypothetical protein
MCLYHFSMNSLQEELDRVAAELATIEAEHARLGARAEGLRAERDALSRAVAALATSRDKATSGEVPSEEIARMVRNDAIVAVLRNAIPTPLRAAGIAEALTATGRTNESPTNVSVYLDGLLKQKRVQRVDRGLYTVPD